MQVEETPSSPSSAVDSVLTVEEMFRRIRRRTKITRGRFKGQLKRAFRQGLIRVIPGPGVCLELTEEGRLVLGEDLAPIQ